MYIDHISYLRNLPILALFLTAKSGAIYGHTSGLPLSHFGRHEQTNQRTHDCYTTDKRDRQPGAGRRPHPYKSDHPWLPIVQLTLSTIVMTDGGIYGLYIYN